MGFPDKFQGVVLILVSTQLSHVLQENQVSIIIFAKTTQPVHAPQTQVGIVSKGLNYLQPAVKVDVRAVVKSQYMPSKVHVLLMPSYPKFLVSVTNIIICAHVRAVIILRGHKGSRHTNKRHRSGSLSMAHQVLMASLVTYIYIKSKQQICLAES